MSDPDFRRRLRIFVFWVVSCAMAMAQKPENVLIVANRHSPVSKAITEYYARARSIPVANICYLETRTEEHIPREVYEREIARPVMEFLLRNKLREQIRYIVTTLGVPLGVRGDQSGMTDEGAAVDSELTLLYQRMAGKTPPLKGPLANPYFQKTDAAFSHAAFPIYLVTRLAGFDLADVKGMIDRSLKAANRGKIVLDLRSNSDDTGNDWLRTASIRLPAGRVVLEESTDVLYGEKDVIAYASWGSNDKQRKQRHLGFGWLPGAIVTEYVSSNGRTFQRPPEEWNLSTWAEADKGKWFQGSPQSLTADFIHNGASAATGHVYEPYLGFCPRPDYFLPAYLKGRNLAESFYLSIPAVSWMNVVVGDPLMRLQ